MRLTAARHRRRGNTTRKRSQETTAIPWTSTRMPGRAKPVTVISALAGKFSRKICLRSSTKRSPWRESLMNTVIVTMSESPLPPALRMVASSFANTSRTWASNSTMPGAAVWPASQTVRPPLVTTARENARWAPRSSVRWDRFSLMSVNFDIGRLDDLGPLDDFGLDVGREFLGGIAHHVRAGAGDQLAHLGPAQLAGDFLVQSRHDRRRGACGRQDAEPGGRLEPRPSGFDDRRHVR